jgi:hypothetical protein
MNDPILPSSLSSGGTTVEIHIQPIDTDTVTSTQVHIVVPTALPNRQRQVTDRIAAVLDPSTLDGRSFLHDKVTWDEPHLQRLVSAIEPADLMVINRKRQAARLEEPAKTLEWKNLTLVDKKGVKVLDDVSGILNPGELVGVLGGPGQCICIHTYTHTHTYI